MGLSNYIEKALEIVMEKETDKWINKLEKSESATRLAYIYGYEKGCKDKDLEQEQAVEALNKIDTEVIIKYLDNLLYLIEFLKRDEDILVKSKVVQDIVKLNQYISDSVNNGND